MSIEKRRFIRFSLDIPAVRFNNDGEPIHIMINQISIGGCFLDWEDSLLIGQEFRLEILLPNKNYLPLACKAVYRFNGKGIGVKFVDIFQFEQELIAEIISDNLESAGLPVLVDPFIQPPRFIEEKRNRKHQNVQEDELLDIAIATEN